MQKQNDEKIFFQYFENIQTKRQKEFVHLNNNCLFCQETLEIQFEKKVEGNTVFHDEIRELVFCPNCELKSKSRYHLVQ